MTTLPSLLPLSLPHRFSQRLPLSLLSLPSLLCALVLLPAPGLAQAQQPAPVAPAAAPATIEVHATRDPVDKSYRKMIAGMERHARRQASLAPGSTLRFQLLPRLPSVRMDGIAIKIVGDSLALPVPLAPDNSFTLPRNAQALREDAALVANRKTTSMTWRADVRSPGVPAGARRLGDLRLECEVGVEAGLVSNGQKLFAWLGDLLDTPEKVCGAPDGNYLFFAGRPLFGVTLRQGTRSMALPLRMLYAGGEQTAATLPYCDCQSLLDQAYYVPLWDPSWPDDTLVEFEYMTDPG